MASNLARHVSTRQTPQNEPIPLRDMVQNNQGGYCFAVDDWTRLDRFLVLGTEGGSFYATERKLTQESAASVLRCASADHSRTVNRIVEISVQGRAVKNDYAVFALAIVASQGSPEARAAALGRVKEVCRIGTHLFQFVQTCQELRGWGRGLRRAVAGWYEDRMPDALAYQLVKYQKRNGFSHRDLLRLSHAQMNTPLIRWAIGADSGPRQVKRTRSVEGKPEVFRVDSYDAANEGTPPELITGFEAVKKATSAAEVAQLVYDYNLVRECIPTQWLNDPAVWDALLQKMPATAMIRNLGKMTAVGLLTPLSEASKQVVLALGDLDKLKKARVHPMTLLVAQKVYAQGQGEKGKLVWKPDQNIVDALGTAFYTAFDAVVPSGKRFMIGIDVSASMSHSISGGPLSCCEAATALALVTTHVEPWCFTGRFNTGLEQVPFTRSTRLDEALRYTRSINGGGTDCSLPMVYAGAQKIPVDTFIVLTDSETRHGGIHPCQALREYRHNTGIPAKLVVVGMEGNAFSIADPLDAGMMDVVGFDSETPAILSDFAAH